jgi:hypothetical protein
VTHPVRQLINVHTQGDAALRWLILDNWVQNCTFQIHVFTIHRAKLFRRGGAN